MRCISVLFFIFFSFLGNFNSRSANSAPVDSSNSSTESWYAYFNDEGGIFSVYSEQIILKSKSVFVQSQRWTKEDGKIQIESVGSSADVNSLTPDFFNSRLLIKDSEVITDAIFRESKQASGKIFEISLKTKKQKQPIEHLKKSITVDFILASHFPLWLHRHTQNLSRDTSKKSPSPSRFPSPFPSASSSTSPASATKKGSPAQNCKPGSCNREISFLVETQESDGFPIRKAKATLQKCENECLVAQGSSWKVQLSETPQPIAQSVWTLDSNGQMHQVEFPDSKIIIKRITEKQAKEWLSKNPL